MRVATWNINSVRVRAEQLVNFLRSSDIDVILLQELKCLEEAFPKEMLEDIGYNCAVFGQKTYNGVAIVSKYMIEDVVLGSSVFQDDSQSRYIEAFINGYNMASVYVPNGQSPDAPAYRYKLEFLERFKDYLSNSVKDEKYIIGGDFNVALTDEDVYNPKAWHGKICCTDREREKLQEIIDLGFKDVAHEFSTGEERYTWWDYRHSGFAKNHGLRLDYIFATKNVEFKDCYVDKEVRAQERPSDHAPVIVEVVEVVV